MTRASMTPEPLTRSYTARSLNMRSIVTWKGPAFLLRITSASSPRVASDILHLHGEKLALVVHVHQVVDAELVHRARGGVGGRGREGQVARRGLAPRERAVQERRAREREHVVGDLLRAADRLDHRAHLVGNALALGLERSQHGVPAVVAEAQPVVGIGNAGE